MKMNCFSSVSRLSQEQWAVSLNRYEPTEAHAEPSFHGSRRREDATRGKCQPHSHVNRRPVNGSTSSFLVAEAQGVRDSREGMEAHEGGIGVGVSRRRVQRRRAVEEAGERQVKLSSGHRAY